MLPAFHNYGRRGRNRFMPSRIAACKAYLSRGDNPAGATGCAVKYGKDILQPVCTILSFCLTPSPIYFQNMETLFGGTNCLNINRSSPPRSGSFDRTLLHMSALEDAVKSLFSFSFFRMRKKLENFFFYQKSLLNQQTYD